MMKWLSKIFDADNLRSIKKDPFNIRHFEFPTRKQQMTAIQLDPKSIACIANPDTLVVYEAVRLDPSAIRYIDTIDEDLADFAIGINPIAFKYIIRKTSAMSDKFYLNSLELMPTLIKHLKNPTPEQQLAAVKAKHNAIGAIKNPTLEACEEALRRYPPHIRHMPLCKENILAYLSKITRDARWADKRIDVKQAKLTEDEWWEIVKEYPQHYELLTLTEEQISYAQICS